MFARRTRRKSLILSSFVARLVYHLVTHVWTRAPFLHLSLQERLFVTISESPWNASLRSLTPLHPPARKTDVSIHCAAFADLMLYAGLNDGEGKTLYMNATGAGKWQVLCHVNHYQTLGMENDY